MRTIYQLASEAGLNYHEYDTALPAEWVADARRSARTDPTRYNIVWAYDGAYRLLGHPVALDDDARQALSLIEEEIKP